jgi:ATP phosphoribosyltransferase
MTGNSQPPLVLAIASKGRLMEQTTRHLASRGLALQKNGSDRGYRGIIAGLAGIEVALVSSAEIAQLLRTGEAHLGITGEDLVREAIADADDRVDFLRPLGFGGADVVVAVPEFWVDVATMADLEEAAVAFRRRHSRRMRVATKYTSLTRRFFAGQRFGAGARPSASIVSSYRIAESLGATEGAPAAGAAELVVDITTTGSTLRANGLKVLVDGVILRSEAHLIASKAAAWPKAALELRDELVARLG